MNFRRKARKRGGEVVARPLLAPLGLTANPVELLELVYLSDSGTQSAQYCLRLDWKQVSNHSVWVWLGFVPFNLILGHGVKP